MEQHYSYVAHSDSDLIGILPGPISGDFYLIGTTVQLLNYITIRRMNIEYNQQWSQTFLSDVSNSAFEIDNSETYIYIVAYNTAQFDIRRLSTSDGAIDTARYREVGLKTTYRNTAMSIIITDDILYFSADDGSMNNYLCK